MKKYLLLLPIIFLTACEGPIDSSSAKEESSTSEAFVSGEYTEEMKYEKLWETKRVHNETCTMIEYENGERYATLMYTPTNILEVRNFSLEEVYGTSEYEIRGNRIYMTSSSTMPYLTQDNISTKTMPEAGAIGTYDDGKGGHILFTEGMGLVYHQINVTYEHEDTWTGTIPEKKGSLLPKLQKKLANKSDINFVCYGDSIYTGCNASSKLGIEPYLPTFPEAFASEIERVYGSKVTLTNTAVGGKESSWGKANIETGVNQYNPDLVLLGFGMNDGTFKYPVSTFISNIEFMVQSIKNSCPNAEIILAATIVANPASSQNGNQEDYLAGLLELENSYSGVAVLDMTTYSKDLLTKKTSFELYANNINHPCDFMVRGYVANLMNLIEVEKKDA